jgi:hypothetical protein
MHWRSHEVFGSKADYHPAFDRAIARQYKVGELPVACERILEANRIGK